MKHTENAIQGALIHWIKDTYPSVLLLAIRNEDMRKRTDEIDAGHPDLHLEIKCIDNYVHILKLELKKKSGKLSKPQKDWNKWFDENHWAGNCHRAVAYGFDEAKLIVSTWLEHRGTL
jgi:hypothetical protein